MLLKDIKVNKKKRTKRKLLGRGIGTGLGKTAGKGHKGQKARSGAGKPPWFEGGQQRLTQRIPKSGFKNPFPSEYAVLNVGFLNEKFEAGSVVDRASLLSKGCIKNKSIKIKVLGDGDLTKALTVTADKFSKSAEEKITKAGGKAEVSK